MTSPSSMDRHTFLKHLQASGLLSSRELKAAIKLLPRTNRGRVVARTLVEWGLLTRFQAELLLVGKTGGFILGQYRILDQIGQGGMGRVFKAMHRTMNRVVAIKVLAPQHMKTEKARQMFRREVRAAGKLAHPNIVTAYDASHGDGRYYLVMEYVDGPNLEQLVRDRGPLPVGLACDLARQTANGLQHAFERGMVHRDIKPSNLLVQAMPAGSPFPGCIVKILDFGLARLHEPNDLCIGGDATIISNDKSVMGTPDYLSPEQSQSLHQVDIRSDLYSLGGTLYYLLCGQVPFPGGNALEKLVRHVTEEPVPVEKLRRDVPPVVAGIVRRLLAKEPAHRFQAPADAAHALAPYSEPASAEWLRAEDASAQNTNTRSEISGTVASGLALNESSGDKPAAQGDATLPSDVPISESAIDLFQLVMAERRRERWQKKKALLWSLAIVAAMLGGTLALVLLNR